MPSSIKEDLIEAFVRGLNRIFILWLLSRGSLSGYNIMKKMGELTERNIKSGAIYPILYELEYKGLIFGKWIQKGRRTIKYYSITEEGSKVLEDAREFFKKCVGKVILEFLEKNSTSSEPL